MRDITTQIPDANMEMSKWLRHQCTIGTPLKEIANSLNCALSTVKSMLEVYGITVSEDGKRVVKLPTKGISIQRFSNLPESLINEIQNLYIKGKSIYEISYELKVYPYIVEYVISIM